MVAAMTARVPVSLLLVTALLIFSQPVQGYRRGLSTSGGLLVHSTDRQLLQEGSDNPCGQFPADDPFDGVRIGQQTPNWHEPCRDSSGVVQFCCSAGSTQCACPPNPPTAAGPFGCYNYVDSNTLNFNTGQQCGFTLPSSPATPSPTSTTPSPTSATPSPTSATPSPTSTTPSPTSTPSATSSPTSAPTNPPGGPCTTAPRGSPGSDGTCGFDPAGQGYNLCTTMAGIAFCCETGYTCPTADPVTASNPSFALQVYCQALGPCADTPTSSPTNAPTTNPPTTNAPATNAPTTNAPTTNAPTTSAPNTPGPTPVATTPSPAPTSGPPSGCQTVPSSGSPGVDGTCGYDPSDPVLLPTRLHLPDRRVRRTVRWLQRSASILPSGRAVRILSDQLRSDTKRVRVQRVTFICRLPELHSLHSIIRSRSTSPTA
ncbi:hypothetical protein KFL_003290080 [Klebsormidium nitens]|uniref:Uncharacterized protein n=1 Tax=Klebsormidium nitens TaxID=105231 RepID=A0A1Y1IAT6_KLENI|nr:hypothetical protein KFL_003290080 [Klebsormidium nitens]|eukprot:GAQ87072.1 hypothetical protein KFL_003290080 [Klebsormidium nitens]